MEVQGLWQTNAKGLLLGWEVGDNWTFAWKQYCELIAYFTTISVIDLTEYIEFLSEGGLDSYHCESWEFFLKREGYDLV